MMRKILTATILFAAVALTACSIVLPPNTDALLVFESYNGFTVASRHVFICSPDGIREVDQALSNAPKPDGAETVYDDSYYFYARPASDGIAITEASEFQSDSPPDSDEMMLCAQSLQRYRDVHGNPGRRLPESEYRFSVMRIGKTTYKVISVEPQDESTGGVQYAYHGGSFIGETDIQHGPKTGSWAIPGR